MNRENYVRFGIVAILGLLTWVCAANAVEAEPDPLPADKDLVPFWLDEQGAIVTQPVIVVCDIATVLDKHIKGAARVAVWKDRAKRTRKAIQAAGRTIQAKAKVLAKLKKKRGKKYEKLFEELATLKAEQKATARIKSHELNIERTAIVKQNLEEAYAAIDALAKENHYDLVLAKASGDQRGVVLYAGPSLDITKDVLGRLNDEQETTDAK